ncbi:MAG: hypothetical protein RLT05_04955 [Bauldia litoralis]
MSKPQIFVCCLAGAVLAGAAWWFGMSPAPEPDPKVEMCRRLEQECSARNLQDCQKQVRSICAQAVGGDFLRVGN